MLHCGVQEFVAEEGHAYLPYWMMENLLLQEGERILVKIAELPKGTFVKLQPHSKTFLDISNPKAVLETALRYFATLTVGDQIAIQYNSKYYKIRVVDTKPAAAISIIETDVQVDFAPPEGYVEPQHRPNDQAASSASSVSDATEGAPTKPSVTQWGVFSGNGMRLDGRGIRTPKDGSAATPTNTTAAAAAAAATTLPSSHQSGKFDRPPTMNVDDDDFGEEPWKHRLPGGVRRFSGRYEELRRGGKIPGMIGNARGGQHLDYATTSVDPNFVPFEGTGQVTGQKKRHQ